ncbi:hypothetical protein L208DRAFT_1404983 [Tricholoma matsutake]|nr:hypothetical protein L208DRAFT_1404983 [Tricholoma matsutake 945]
MYYDARLVQLISDTRTTNYFAVASLTLLIYDYSITFQEEVTLIWKGSQWKRAAKIFYIWNRYFTILTVSLLLTMRMSEIKAVNVRPSLITGI